MNPSQTESCENIAKWLMIATNDLCELAKVRITLEIETHYKEAVKSHLSNGKSPEEAQALALQELGDSKKAARRFRRKHLTEKQNEKLAKLMANVNKRQSKFRIAFEVIFFFFLTCASSLVIRYLFPSDSHALAMSFWISLLALTSLMEIWTARILAKKLADRSLAGWLVSDHIFCELASRACLVMLWLSIMQPTTVPFTSFMCMIFFVPSMIRIIPWLRIWQKVRSANCGWDMAPSGSNPTSAS